MITLGVIGIVAALTLPTLIGNYQKTIYVNSLKKAYSVMNNLTKSSMANEDVTSFSDTQLMKAWEGAKQNKTTFEAELKANMPQAHLLDMGNHELRALYAKADTGDYYNLNYWLYKSSVMIYPANELVCMQTSDSIMYCFDTHNAPTSEYSENYYDFQPSSSGGYYSKHILVDINGFKKPNKVGRDIFIFTVAHKSGMVVANGSLAIAQEVANGYKQRYCHGNVSCESSMDDNYRARYDELTKSDYYCKDNGANAYCADKIITDGWKMNY